MKQLNTRQELIFKYVLNYGKVEVSDLASKFDVTEQTIRTDLNKLYQLNLLKRVHGGAMTIEGRLPIDGLENIGYRSRLELNKESKKTIGEKTAEIIPANSSLFINIGTTTEWVAEFLTKITGLMVITNNLHIINRLHYCENITLMACPGMIRKDDGAILGEATIDFIEQFRLDYAIMGISAIDEDGALLDFDFREVRVNKSIIKNSRSVILVSDSTKFNRKASVRLGDLSDIDYFVTDKTPPKKFLNACLENNVVVHMVERKNLGHLIS